MFYAPQNKEIRKHVALRPQKPKGLLVSGKGGGGGGGGGAEEGKTEHSYLKGAGVVTMPSTKEIQRSPFRSIANTKSNQQTRRIKGNGQKSPTSQHGCERDTTETSRSSSEPLGICSEEVDYRTNP